MNELLNLSAAFGLAGAAGLNAYIPLLLVSILTRLGLVHLVAPYDVMGQTWCVVLLAVLCVIEIVVDKVPGADHVNDVIQTFVRPTAGAVLFASQAGTMTGVHPGVWIVMGLMFAGLVHVTKMSVRPVVNLTTGGIGAPVVSVLEDLIATVMSLVALLAPVFVVVGIGVFGWVGWKAYKRFRTRPVVVRAVPMGEVGVASVRVIESREEELVGWGGGV
ncbi:MAG TPA: DUF4126 domain-containing protein [Phycisphaerae bacterium]|nr:DUF4126 domain-containing protein [Phycisphaerae bacterium]